MVAYNLMSLLRYFALNHHNRGSLKTLRVYCFALGAWTVNHANKKQSSSMAGINPTFNNIKLINVYDYYHLLRNYKHQPLYKIFLKNEYTFSSQIPYSRHGFSIH